MSELMHDLPTLRHSTAHILAQAVLKKFPDAKLGIGPAIDDGFYYDFELDTPLTEESLTELEDIMESIIKEDQQFSTFVLSKEESINTLKKTNQPYKCELIEDLGLNEFSFYQNGPFIDLCKGPHIRSTKQVKCFKLTKVSGAYWKGSEKNKMLQRIYGTTFHTKKELRLYLNQLEEAKKRDHRKIGKELNLFSIQESIGPGLVLWHPKGASIRNTIEEHWKKAHKENGYDLIYTPHVGKAGLWKTSGHLDFYEENMYDKMSVETQDYYLRPMNCPFHIMIYKSTRQSYKQLPIRYAELGTVYRYERSGVLQGLFRVRGFTQDDAHIICTKDQVESEITKALDFSLEMLKTFGFEDFKLYISTKPEEKFVGNKHQWETAEQALKKAVEKTNISYDIDNGGGAFYGPKIDIKIKDAIGRQWQCSTIQFDFNLPQQFSMDYISSHSEKEQPFMIHRALLGSIERFFGILIEHYAGWFPAWLAPIQCTIVTVNPSVNDYGNKIKELCKTHRIRCHLDQTDNKISYKIRQAITQKTPYIIIVGDKEKENNSVTLRHKNKNLGTFQISDFLDQYKNEFQGMN